MNEYDADDDDDDDDSGGGDLLIQLSLLSKLSPLPFDIILMNAIERACRMLASRLSGGCSILVWGDI